MKAMWDRTNLSFMKLVREVPEESISFTEVVDGGRWGGGGGGTDTLENSGSKGLGAQSQRDKDGDFSLMHSAATLFPIWRPGKGLQEWFVMTSGIHRVFCNILSSLAEFNFVPVRHRYYAERIARGPYSKKFGYKDKVFQRGPLGRLDDDVPVKKLPIYRPANAWSPMKVAHGQNDYIDILGGGKLDPAKVSYDVPKWLRGRKGNEMQLLLLKQKVYSGTKYEKENPTQMTNMSRRVRYLYRYLNRKTKTNVSKQ